MLTDSTIKTQKMRHLFISIIILGLTVFFSSRTIAQKSLANTGWSLIKITNPITNQTQLANFSCGTALRFEGNGNYNGYSGWNSYDGKYVVTDNSSLTMNNPFRTKRMGESNCKLGESLFDYFATTNKYLIKEDTLFLWTRDSVKIIFLKK